MYSCLSVFVLFVRINASDHTKTTKVEPGFRFWDGMYGGNSKIFMIFKKNNLRWRVYVYCLSSVFLLFVKIIFFRQKTDKMAFFGDPFLIKIALTSWRCNFYSFLLLHPTNMCMYIAFSQFFYFLSILYFSGKKMTKVTIFQCLLILTDFIFRQK